MVEYITDRVISGALDYCKVITNKNINNLNPNIKQELDQDLADKNHAELIRIDCAI